MDVSAVSEVETSCAPALPDDLFRLAVLVEVDQQVLGGVLHFALGIRVAAVRLASPRRCAATSCLHRPPAA